MSDDVVQDPNAVPPGVTAAPDVTAAPAVDPAAAAAAPVEPVAVAANWPAQPGTSADFGDHPLYSGLVTYIEQAGSYASARLHQVLEEMRTLFNNV